jgi:hypothetical protein
MYAHRWMGMISVSALTSFLRLIQAKFQKIRLNFSDVDLIELYQVIAKRLTDKKVDLSQIQSPLVVFGR